MSKGIFYRGKLFSILGDSISTLSGYSIPYDAAYYRGDRCDDADIHTPPDTWWGRVIDHLGGELLVNNSISGSLASKHPDCMTESYGCSDERTSSLGAGDISPDVIMVALGANDRGWGMKPTPETDAERDDISVFSVAYSLMLEKLRRAYPQSEIWCLTIPVGCKKSDPSVGFPLRLLGRHISEYCEVIRTAASEQGCRVVDLYKSPEPYDTLDTLHPNRDGMMTIADAVIAAIEG